MEPMSAAGRDRDRIPGVAEEPARRSPSCCGLHLLGGPPGDARRLHPRRSVVRGVAGRRPEEFERRLPRPWLDLIREVTGRGVPVRRARVVSEPVTDYIRFEHATTDSNVAAGEQVRWLPRHAGHWAAAARQRLLGVRRPAGAVQLLLRGRASSSIPTVRRPGDRQAVRRGVRGRMGARDAAPGLPAPLADWPLHCSRLRPVPSRPARSLPTGCVSCGATPGSPRGIWPFAPDGSERRSPRSSTLPGRLPR